MKVKTRVELNHTNIGRLEAAFQRNLIKTADAVKTDLQQSQTMPFDTGNMQNRSTFVDKSDVEAGTVRVVVDTPYARRLYFHPEYNFSTRENPNAGGEWFEPYISGEKKDYVQKTFAVFMKSALAR